MLPTQPPVRCVPGLSRGESGLGVVLTTHPHLAPRLRKEYSYTSTPPLGLRGCARMNLTFTFTFTFTINLLKPNDIYIYVIPQR